MGYEDLVKKYKEMEKELENFGEDIRKEFVDYLRKNKPEAIKELEDYFKIKINDICFVVYEDECWNRAEMVLIKTDNEETMIRVELNTSDYWEHDELALREKDFSDDTVFYTINNLQSLCPYVKEEYV